MINMRLAVATASLILAFVSGWMVKGWQTDAQTLQAYQDAVEKGNAMGKKLEGVLTKLEENKFIVQKETHHETTKQVYRDCIVPDSGIRLFNKSAGYTSEP